MSSGTGISKNRKTLSWRLLAGIVAISVVRPMPWMPKAGACETAARRFR